jgi:hypothetical protein
MWMEKRKKQLNSVEKGMVSTKNKKKKKILINKNIN